MGCERVFKNMYTSRIVVIKFNCTHMLINTYQEKHILRKTINYHWMSEIELSLSQFRKKFLINPVYVLTRSKGMKTPYYLFWGFY